MPSIQTIVADLNSGAVTGIGAKPPSNETNNTGTISGTCRVKYNFVHMLASISATNRFTCASAVASPNFNGSYVHFEDDWATVGNMDVNRPLIASGNFSGCTYKVYRSENPALFKCVHIARPAGGGANALVTLVDNYAQQVGWAEIRSVPTVGLIGVNGCAEVYLVSQLFSNVRIETIRLEVNNMGTIVGHTMWSDAI